MTNAWDMNNNFPDSKVRGANMRPTWVLSAPDGPHVGPITLAIRVYTFELKYVISGFFYKSWWRHEMETFSALLATCAENSPVPKANAAELWFFYDLHHNQRSSKQSWGWWFETPSRPLWRHRYDVACQRRSPPHIISLKINQGSYIWPGYAPQHNRRN